jgi:hypothetical protein
MTELYIKQILTEELFGTSICESFEDTKIVNFFYKNFLLEKLLWGEPVSVEELRKLLRQKILNFEFVKLNGDVRPARGTTMMKHIPTKDHPKGIRPSSPKVATFFDLDKKEWRSVSNKSKEIVLKKDEEKDRPIIVISDKGAKAPEKIEKPKDKEKISVDKIERVRDKERLGPETEDVLEPGDIRNYLNRNNKNVIIEITRLNDDGSLYAKTYKEKTPFYIPSNKVVNIGEIVPPEELEQLKKPISSMPLSYKKEEKPIILKPVTPQTPEGKKAMVVKPGIIDKLDSEELLK